MECLIKLEQIAPGDQVTLVPWGEKKGKKPKGEKKGKCCCFLISSLLRGEANCLSGAAFGVRPRGHGLTAPLPTGHPASCAGRPRLGRCRGLEHGSVLPREGEVGPWGPPLGPSQGDGAPQLLSCPYSKAPARTGHPKSGCDADSAFPMTSQSRGLAEHPVPTRRPLCGHRGEDENLSRL